MTLNVGKYDRIVRIIVGLGLLSLYVTGPETVWGLIGIVPLVTGLLGKCALYSLFGISTRSTH